MLAAAAGAILMRVTAGPAVALALLGLAFAVGCAGRRPQAARPVNKGRERARRERGTLLYDATEGSDGGALESAVKQMDADQFD